MDKIEQLVSDVEITPLGKKVIELSNDDIHSIIAQRLTNEGCEVQKIVINITRRLEMDGHTVEWVNVVDGAKVYIK